MAGIRRRIGTPARRFVVAVFVRRAITLVLVSGAASAVGAQERAAGSGSVVGGVRDSSGAAIAGAEIRVERSTLRTTSDAAGRFLLRAVPAGARQLTVRRMGFRPVALDAVVRAGEETQVDVALAAVALQLAPVIVSERRDVYDSRLAGFNDRMAKRRSGYFITKESIDASRLIRFTDLMRTVPGARVTSTSGIGMRMVRLRGATCPPLVFVDGFPASAGEFDLDMIEPSTVEGVEIYGSSTSVPVELLGPRGLDRCGVIAIWSRPARARAATSGGPRNAGGEGAGSRGTVGGGAPDRASLTEQVASRSAYVAEQVDVPAELVAGTGIPPYPDSLWQRKIPGRTVLEFVVNASGEVEMETVGIVSATHPHFADAGREALASARFRPAELDGVPVRQVVQLPFEFDPIRVRHALPDSAIRTEVPSRLP